MPFDEDESSNEPVNRIGLKKPISPQSLSEKNKKPSQEDFEKKVKEAQERNISYKQRASELALQFKKIMEDKTLVQNKSVFSSEIEREVLSKMVQLAIEINNDPNEQEGMGSLSWITLLFKTAISQRDKINNLDYTIFQLEKKVDLIEKLLQSLDKKSSNG